ncbi:hypothetical protein [Streptomyces sp. IMTB 2501]|uniref:hypothetical protein n=1 Tax=Streptomyces sp. IMTB 2501 TaxID=1776340 RepID=UPI003531908E
MLAQPLVTGKNVVVATENNYVYGIDAVTGKTNWTRQLGPAWPTSSIPCADPAPHTGSPPRRCTTRRPTPSTSPARSTTARTRSTRTGTSTR